MTASFRQKDCSKQNTLYDIVFTLCLQATSACCDWHLGLMTVMHDGKCSKLLYWRNWRSRPSVWHTVWQVHVHPAWKAAAAWKAVHLLIRQMNHALSETSQKSSVESFTYAFTSVNVWNLICHPRTLPFMCCLPMSFHRHPNYMLLQITGEIKDFEELLIHLF